MENRSAPSLLVKLSRPTPGTALPAASLRRGDYLILNSLLCAAPACASSAVVALRRVALFGLPHCRLTTHCRTAPLTYHTYPNALSLECTALTVLRNAGTPAVLSSVEVTVKASFGARYVSTPGQEHVVIAPSSNFTSVIQPSDRKDAVFVTAHVCGFSVVSNASTQVRPRATRGPDRSSAHGFCIRRR